MLRGRNLNPGKLKETRMDVIIYTLNPQELLPTTFCDSLSL
jgi:hypothetical protein